MQKKIRFEDMQPDELLEIQERGLPVYLPVGSMEWHSYHLGMGVDGVHAYEVALRTAERLGGAVFPPLYIGTENPRTSESLKRLGFEGHEKILGMDFPNNTLKSCYWPPELFKQIVETQVWQLLDMGFRRIGILNGHGALIQRKILEDLCQACGQEGGLVVIVETQVWQLLDMGFRRIGILNGHGALIQRKILEDLCQACGQEGGLVVSVLVLFPECGVGLGHAGLAETALMQALRPEMVSIEKLPPKPQPLHYREFGIADAGGHKREHYVHYDWYP